MRKQIRRPRVRLADYSETEILRRFGEDAEIQAALKRYRINAAGIARMLAYRVPPLSFEVQREAVASMLKELPALRRTLVRTVDSINKIIRPALSAPPLVNGPYEALIAKGHTETIWIPLDPPIPSSEIGALDELANRLRALNDYLGWYRGKRRPFKAEKGSEMETDQIRGKVSALRHMFEQKDISNPAKLIVSILNCALSEPVDEQYVHKLHSRKLADDRKLDEIGKSWKTLLSDVRKQSKKRRDASPSLPLVSQEQSDLTKKRWPYHADKS